MGSDGMSSDTSRMLVFLLLGCTAVNAKIKSSFNFKDMTKYHGLRIEHETALLTMGAKSDIKFWKEKDELLVLDANMIITGNLDVRGKLTAKGSNVGGGGGSVSSDQVLKIFKGWNTHFQCEPGWSGPLCNQAAKCAPGSPSNCKLEQVNAPGYSAGTVFKVTTGRAVRKTTDKNSCPAGFKIWSPRNKKDWTIIYNAMKKNINNYPRKPHLLIDVTKASNGCNGCRNYAMKSTVAQQKVWRTQDGSAWWLRDSKYNEPSGDYHANCYLHVSNVNPNDVRFNDANCAHYSSAYLCQPKKGTGPPKTTKKPSKTTKKPSKTTAKPGRGVAKLSVARLTKKNSGYGGDQTNAIPGRTLNFSKKLSNSFVKVTYAESLRVYGNGKWCRWTIKIDGKDCKPTVYNSKHTTTTSDNNHTR